jgi:hypothetical protein
MQIMSSTKKELKMNNSDRDRQILEMANQGLTYGYIADIFGIQKARVSQICLKNGIIRRPAKINPELWEKDWDESRAEKICE